MSTSSFPAAACRRTGRALDRLQVRLLLPVRAVVPLSSPVSRRPRRPAQDWPPRVLRRSRSARRPARLRRRPHASAPDRVGRLRQATLCRTPAVLAYLARYAHRVAISNSRLIAIDQADVTFKWKDYRIKGRDRLRTMTLDAAEFIRRFLLHVLPSGFHRIRHYGLFAGAVRARNIERVRQWLAAPEASPAETDCDFEDPNTEGPSPGRSRCPCCGGPDDHRPKPSTARAPRARHRRPGSGSTPHDHRDASRLAMLIAFASPRAPERERDVLTTSPRDSLQPLRHTHRSHPRPRKSASCSLLTITPAALHPRRHIGSPSATPKIPIGPAQPNRASSFPRFPPSRAFGRRPRAQSQPACKGPPSGKTLQSSGH